ncbi:MULTISPECIES: ANTAR domain-containing protein [Mycobacteriaceae]|uniref:ANTAR domain-containing protein n=2 Tax=Mycobacteriaceae TaxID=1762 RepID=A0ABW9LKY6_9MYCO|nr:MULTISPECIES: ANTAR domain-containing protein [Mycobacteriaceae]MEB3052267.1 ANTAR domain-containing protein [Mycolicibacter sp. MYC123]
MIDVAIGVLIGWRGCSERDAFDEIACAVRESGVGIGSIARWRCVCGAMSCRRGWRW